MPKGHYPSRKRCELTGNTYGQLTVLGPAPRTDKHTRWRCLCECGKEVSVRADNLKSGSTVSCGCHSAKVAKGNAAEWNKRQIEISEAKKLKQTLTQAAEELVNIWFGKK